MRTNWGARANAGTPDLLPEYEASVGAVIEALKSYWGNEISVRSRWLRSLFVWLRAIVCPRISCWAVTPFGTLAKPEQRVQPMQNAG